MCGAAEMKSGILKPTGEMARYRWYNAREIEQISPIGKNYRKMLGDWRATCVRSTLRPNRALAE
jgi:hypothetical protein